MSEEETKTEKIELDTEEFEAGITMGSYWAGFAASLLAVGLDRQDVAELIKNRMVLEAELQVAHMARESGEPEQEDKMNIL